jgi:(S)-ureidoglycine-glyoxylate aminotransferase
MPSVLAPDDKVLVPICGRFGLLLIEIAQRCQAEVVTIEAPWGTVFAPEQIEAALEPHRPKFLALVHGDTSTTMAQPLAEIGALCRRYDALVYVDATAAVPGMALKRPTWQLDAKGLCGRVIEPSRDGLSWPLTPGANGAPQIQECCH